MSPLVPPLNPQPTCDTAAAVLSSLGSKANRSNVSSTWVRMLYEGIIARRGDETAPERA
jgi:hypothetical protein